MMIVVLLTLLLLSAVLAVSLRLGINSRQTVADQAATLQAQYQAESGLAVSRSRLQDLQRLLSENNVELSSTVYITELHQMAKQFCGKENTADSTAWVNAPEFQQPRHGNDTRIFNDAKQCLFTGNAGAKQFEVLAQAVKSYQAFPASERPTSNNKTALQSWWATQLNTNTTDSAKDYTSTMQVNATRSVKLTNGVYRFYFALDSLQSQSTTLGSSRFLKANRAKDSEWWIEIKNPNLLENVMMTNHHRQRRQTSSRPNVYFTKQNFEGSIHTNEHFLFSSTSTARFQDAVTSAGCTDLPAVGEPLNGTCSRDPRLYINGSVYYGNYPGSNDPNAILSPQVPMNVQTNPEKPIDFTSSYKSLPTTTDIQKQQSQNGGIYISNSPAIMIMAGDANGNPLSSYNTNQKSWNEPSETYQYISLYNSTGSNIDQNNRYRFDKDNNLQKWNPSASSWQATGNQFNGTIYSPGRISIFTPDRLNNDTTGSLQNIPPALASFANMTLAAETGIDIQSDITVSNTPCNFSEVKLGQCNKNLGNVNNMLGLYSRSGDISFSTNTPSNLHIHAALMASSGEISAQAYDTRPVQGDINFIGSAIMNYYGAFGTFVGDGQRISGYGRNFSHDQRFLNRTPRGMPTSPSWEIQDAKKSNRALDEFIWKQSSKGDL